MGIDGIKKDATRGAMLQSQVASLQERCERLNAELRLARAENQELRDGIIEWVLSILDDARHDKAGRESPKI